MSLFYSRFTFKLSFLFRFSTWKWLFSEGNHATISNINICHCFEILFFWFLIALSLCKKSAILGLSFLDTKDLCLPNKFSRGSWQKRSVSTYLTWFQRRNLVALMTKLTLISNPSYVFHNINIFCPASFVKIPWRWWAVFSQSWKRKIWSHKNLWSLTDLSGASIGFHSNSKDWSFRMFIMSKINHLINKNVLFWQDL